VLLFVYNFKRQEPSMSYSFLSQTTTKIFFVGKGKKSIDLASLSLLNNWRFLIYFFIFYMFIQGEGKERRLSRYNDIHFIGRSFQSIELLIKNLFFVYLIYRRSSIINHWRQGQNCV
jgi:hypothetical protein